MALACEVDCVLPDCEGEYHRTGLVKPTQKLHFVDFVMVPYTRVVRLNQP